MSALNDPWVKLLNQARRKQEGKANEKPRSKDETRTEIERDHDRILFSTPVRRLADKTQVFPLDKNDSVRTRLTHSNEVSNLARSIGTALVFEHNIAAGVQESKRNLPAVLAAVGLAHDLGNPPFGHQGESAIQSWFQQHKDAVLGSLTNQQHVQDFVKFEGNAQSLRLVTRLQLLNDDFGLDLTYATLAALMKYPTSSDQTSGATAATKKHGFFASEQQIASTVLDRTGLVIGKRHPLAYVMEACDDIAYVVMDVEDAVKKGLASYADVIAHLKHGADGDDAVLAVVKKSEEKHKKYRSNFALSPSELNDVSMQRFRVAAIGSMVRKATEAFVKYEEDFVSGDSAEGLIKRSEGEQLRKLLKEFGYKYAYSNRAVLKVELQGYNVIRKLMDMFWVSICDRETEADPKSARRGPFTRFVYGRISENYRRVFEQPAADVAALPMRYRECLLLTDMMSGMTDSFAMDLCLELESLRGDFDPVRFIEKTK